MKLGKPIFMAIIRSIRGSNTGFQIFVTWDIVVICQRVGHNASLLFPQKVYMWSCERELLENGRNVLLSGFKPHITQISGLYSAPMWTFTQVLRLFCSNEWKNSSEKWNVCNGNVIDRMKERFCPVVRACVCAQWFYEWRGVSSIW